MLQDTDRQLIRDFNRNVEFIKAQTLKEKKQTWVPASVITEMTGWNREKLRQRREQGLIQFRVKNEGDIKNSYEYLLESIHPLFIKNKE